MKQFPWLFVLAFAGCQTPPATIPAASPPVAAAAPALAAPPQPDLALQRRVRQQAQYIEALLSQNEALSAGKDAAGPAPYPSPVARALMKPLAAGTNAVDETGPSTLVPNADGLIDLSAASEPSDPNRPGNPFVVRAVATGPGREVALEVGGIVAGPVACAVINDRLVQAGETAETLVVEHIEADAVILRHGTQRIRVPVGMKNVRVRLPI